jgi:hypothetical protein
MAGYFSHINLISLTIQELRPEDRFPLQNPRSLFWINKLRDGESAE